MVRAGIVGDVPCLHVECLCTTLNFFWSGMQHVKAHTESKVAIGKLLPQFCVVFWLGRGYGYEVTHKVTQWDSKLQFFAAGGDRLHKMC